MNASLIEQIDVGEMKRECMRTVGEKASSQDRKIADACILSARRLRCGNVAGYLRLYFGQGVADAPPGFIRNLMPSRKMQQGTQALKAALPARVTEPIVTD
jgi:hypothetical protein